MRGRHGLNLLLFFGGFRSSQLLGFFRNFAGSLFLGAAFLLFDLTQLRLFAEPRLFNLALALLDVLAFARLKEAALPSNQARAQCACALSQQERIWSGHG
ncbi:MAG: hypothetical protein HY765_08115 [Rhodomicrobium sp.]|nr:hypothetical protein [Rhodomicrobium sp.]